MKTLEELYAEVMASYDLRNRFVIAESKGKASDFARRHGVEATNEEIGAFLEAKLNEGVELSDDDLEMVAGGADKGEHYLLCPSCGLQIEYPFKTDKCPKCGYDISSIRLTD